MNNTKKLVVLSLLTSIGIVLGIIENGIPLPIRVPGAKLGLSNVVQLVVIVVIGYREGLTVGILKSLLISVGTGSMGSLLYSLPAAISSTAVMIAVYHFAGKKFSLIGVSVFGALTHNFTQLLVASLIIGNFRIFTYYPFMAIISIFTGYFIGLVSKQFKLHLEKVNLEYN